EWGEGIGVAVSPGVFDLYILPVYVAGVPETLQKTTHIRREHVGGCAVKETHHGHRLLRVRRERPRSGDAEQRDELATPHSITSSARATKAGGTARTTAAPVLRL